MHVYTVEFMYVPPIWGADPSVPQTVSANKRYCTRTVQYVDSTKKTSVKTRQALGAFLCHMHALMAVGVANWLTHSHIKDGV